MSCVSHVVVHGDEKDEQLNIFLSHHLSISYEYKQSLTDEKKMSINYN